MWGWGQPHQCSNTVNTLTVANGSVGKFYKAFGKGRHAANGPCSKYAVNVGGEHIINVSMQIAPDSKFTPVQ